MEKGEQKPHARIQPLFFFSQFIFRFFSIEFQSGKRMGASIPYSRGSLIFIRQLTDFVSFVFEVNRCATYSHVQYTLCLLASCFFAKRSTTAAAPRFSRTRVRVSRFERILGRVWVVKETKFQYEFSLSLKIEHVSHTHSSSSSQSNNGKFLESLIKSSVAKWQN